MLSYKEYEEHVYNWLSAKNKKDPSFTFSTRIKGSKGAELDYFIGTEKSKYFGTTFWTIHVNYPGSASDCINLFFYQQNGQFDYKFEFKQTSSPYTDQNKIALKLVKALIKPLKTSIGVDYESGKDIKLYKIISKPGKNSYDRIEEMLKDIDKNLSELIPIVDRIIKKVKKEYPKFIAHRITSDEFFKMSQKMKDRLTKYAHLKTILVEDSEIENNNLKSYLNTILYGPPGTGKTYNTILRAAEIIEERKVGNYHEAKEVFNSHLGDRIEFITFHQNYSYEDFIQGLRPDTEKNSALTFEKKDGVFKRISTNALFEYYRIWKQQSTNASTISMNEIYLDFVQYLKDNDDKVLKSSTGIDVLIANFNKNDNIEFRSINKSKTYLVSGPRLLKLFDAFPKISLIKKVDKDIRGAIGGCNTTLYWAALNEFIKFNNKHSKDLFYSKEDIYEEIGYDSKVRLLSTVNINELNIVKDADVPKYVIIIDEINRANISRVFGELITLIEPDKRSHGEIPLKTTLPSGDQFIVPSNLYIIGTMNTADKSIALLDIALRRRFEFEAIYPKYSIDGHAVHDSEILKKINKKIIDTKGHDFQIGHSYFMGSDFDLKDRMNKKVIPLLLEYYMNDADEVKNILLHAELEIEENSWPIKIVGKRA